MPDTTGTINAKKLGDTGFTEDILDDLFSRVGAHVWAIIDLQVVDKHGPSVKGKRAVTLLVDSIEPVLDDAAAEHVRELQRTLYYNRSLNGHTGDTTAGTGVERTVEDVLAAGAAHRPHPFLPVDATDEQPICDVCGHLEAAGVHSTQDALPEPEGDEPDPTLNVDGGDPDDDAGGEDLPTADPDWEYPEPEPAHR